ATARTRSRTSRSQAAYSCGATIFTSRKRWLTLRISTVTRAVGASARPAPYPVMLRTPSNSSGGPSAARAPRALRSNARAASAARPASTPARHPPRAAPVERGHALPAPRDAAGLRRPALEEPPAGGRERGAVADVDARGLRRLGAIRLHERGAAVVGEVGALRIDDPDERRARVGLRERCEQLRPDHAFRVVGHHHHVEARASA